jgi:hypothetical protein
VRNGSHKFFKSSLYALQPSAVVYGHTHVFERN